MDTQDKKAEAVLRLLKLILVPEIAKYAGLSGLYEIEKLTARARIEAEEALIRRIAQEQIELEAQKEAERILALTDEEIIAEFKKDSNLKATIALLRGESVDKLFSK